MKPKYRLTFGLITAIIILLSATFAVVFYIVAKSQSSLSKNKISRLQVKSENFHTILSNAPIFTYDFQNKPAILSTQKCSSTNVKIKRILGGGDALAHSHPWIVSLRMLKNNVLYGHFCSGSLLATNKVLTSAHCVKKIQNNTVVLAVVGLHSRDDVSTYILRNSFTVYKISLHENFNETTLNNDLAILTLTNHVRLNQNVSVICLPDSNVVRHNKKVLVAGWGKNRINSYKLQQINLSLLDKKNDKCSKYFKQVRPDNFYCAIGMDQDSLSNVCSGDRFVKFDYFLIKVK